MLPNSRIVPPPSPVHADPPLLRQRSLSASAPVEPPRAKGFFSRLITNANAISATTTSNPDPKQGMTNSSSLPQLTLSVNQTVRRKPVSGKPVSPTGLEVRPSHGPTVAPESAATMSHAGAAHDLFLDMATDEKKSPEKGSIKGFTKLFKKRGKVFEDPPTDEPMVRLVGNTHSTSSRHHPIPLAPPPLPPQHGSRPIIQNFDVPSLSIDAPSTKPAIQSPSVHDTAPTSSPTAASTTATLFTTIIPPPIPNTKYSYSTPTSTSTNTRGSGHDITIDDISIAETNIPSRWSRTSTRKSSGSYSIYSTFGTDSHYSSEDSEKSPEELAQIVANNMQRRHPARVLSPPSKNAETQSDADSDTDDDDDGDVFVDATGPSQEDMERENVAKRLSKRLSGGHFGSAGGLMLSIMDQSEQEDEQDIQPPPKDLAQAMLNWKRQSGCSVKRSAPMHRRSTTFEKEDLPTSKEISVEVNAKNDSIEFKDTLLKTLDDAWQGPDLSFGSVKGIPAVDLVHKEDGGETPQHAPEQEQDHVQGNQDAQRLWDEDESFVALEHMAEWLGQTASPNACALIHYMDRFDFSDIRLDRAFRKLCSKLYFKAEAQQIDRILEAFAKRYWQCNPQCLFGSADVVYAVVYSLLLLNTDLHVAQGNHARMTRQAFTRNTMATIREQHQQPQPSSSGKPIPPVYLSKAWEADMEAYLKDLYTSVKQHQILQPLSRRRPSHAGSERRSSILLGGGRRVLEMKRSMGAMVRKATRDSLLLPEDVTRKLDAKPLPAVPTSPDRTTLPSLPSPTSATAHPTGFPTLSVQGHRDSFCSVASGTSVGSHIARSISASPNIMLPSMINFMNTHASALFTNRSPYVKEGVVMRKHLLEHATQKARHRDWRECFLVVAQGELRMYALQNNSSTPPDPERKKALRASSASLVNLTDTLSRSSSSNHIPLSTSFGGVAASGNRWASYSQLMATVKLNHSFSNVLPPPGYNRQRPHVFAIQQANGGVYLFQVASQEHGAEWVETCNYWAARESKEPLKGGVSNIEYGWGACLDDVILNLDADDHDSAHGNYSLRDPDIVSIYDWKPPVPPTVSSLLDERDQYDTLRDYLDELNNEINEHRELKKKIVVKFPTKCHNHSKVMANWEARSKYMLHEIIKYQNYCDALEKSLERWQQEYSKTQITEEDEEEIPTGHPIH